MLMEADILTSEGKIDEASAMVESAAKNNNNNSYNYNEITLLTVKASITTTKAFTVLNQGPNEAVAAQTLFAVIIITIIITHKNKTTKIIENNNNNNFIYCFYY